jgi:hypothetical protein
MTTWDLIDAEVREYSINGDQRAKDLFTKAIAAAEARGYAKAKELAANEGAAAANAWLGGKSNAERCGAYVAMRIRAMKDEG